MIEELLNNDSVNQRLAAELMKNMTPKEIWERLKASTYFFNLELRYLIINFNKSVNNWRFIHFFVDKNIISISGIEYNSASEEFKNHLINILENAII